MSDFLLNNETLRAIKTTTGLDASVISSSDISVIDQAIEQRTKAPLEESFSVGGLQPRGSVYLMFSRFFTAKEINDRLAKIKP